MGIESVLASVGATSFAIAKSQSDAVRLALEQAPAFITSDVKLQKGHGPLAVAAIRQNMGPVVVAFVTGSPDSCFPREQDDKVITKPFDKNDLIQAFLSR